MLALVVDDEPDIVALIQIALAGAFEIVSAGTAKAALEIARERKPDLVLMDRRLPDMDGLDLLSQLRSDPTTASIAVILVTGATSEEMPDGVVGIIKKPFDPVGLPERIRAILQKG